MLSIIIPVLNEADSINQAIEALQPLANEISTEVIVVDGDPDGGTLKALDGLDVKPVRSSAGRGPQLNAGAIAAGGNILLFLHVDTRLPSSAARHITITCSDPTVCGGAFDLGIKSPRRVFRAIEKVASLRSRLTRIPYGDQAIFIKTEAFNAVGGFSNIPIMEDIDLMRRLKRQGYRIRFINDPVQTSARRWEKEGIFYTTLRNYCLSTLFYLGMSPHKLKHYYR